MTGVVADANFVGHVKHLVTIFESAEWAAFWTDLKLSLADFSVLGLGHDAPDRIVWNRCQEAGLVLITGNRNHDGPDSLEAAIRDGSPTALPAFTIGDGRRLLTDGAYARMAAIDCLDYLQILRDQPQNLLGSGRLYLPKNPI